MIRSSLGSVVMLALLVLSSSAMAQVELTGELSATEDYEFNGDIVIYDLIITGPVGATMKIVAKDGDIMVVNGPEGFGVRGAGTNGVDGVSGTQHHDPSAGASGTKGYSLSLETRVSVDMPPTNLPIRIFGSIDLHGGSGGSGGSGRDAAFDFCIPMDAQAGAAAGNGGGGGSLIVTANGDVVITKGINTSGGSAGKGGDGGDGGYPGTCAKPGAIGGDGGAAGPVTITQPPSEWLPEQISISMLFEGVVSGFVTAIGGNGGDGGAGGSGTCPCDGSSGGAAGRGGSFTIQGKEFNAIGGIVDDQPVPAGANCTGGNGGSGGAGGSGMTAACFECEDEQYAVPGFGGKAGGAGRNGETGGLIDIDIERDVLLEISSALISRGGNGGNSAGSGNGGVNYGDPCNSPLCESGPTALAAGAVKSGAAGGPGGPIMIFAWGTIYVRASDDGEYFALIDASGGNGGNGGTAGNSGVYCCGMPPVPTAAAGVKGAAGGPGGKGGEIVLQHFVEWDGFTPHFWSCGGNGGSGGNGGGGIPRGGGGPGGGAGSNGPIFVGGLPLFSPCFGANGSNGQRGENPICIMP